MTTPQAAALRINGVERLCRATRLAALIEELGYSGGETGIAVALNDEVIPRSAWPHQEVRSGDRVEIVGAVQGG